MGALKMWPREISQVFKDKIIDEAVHSEIFGEESVVKKEILNKIDKVMTAHMLKEQQNSSTLGQNCTDTPKSSVFLKIQWVV